MSAKRHGDDGGGHLSEALYEFVSGRLEAAEMRRGDAHLKRCAECRDSAAFLRQTLGAAKIAAAVAPQWLSKRAYDRIVSQARYEKVRDAESKLPWWKRFVPQVAATSALAAAAALALVVLRPVFSDAARWTVVQGARTAAMTAPPVAKAADQGRKIGKGMVLAIGKAIEVTLGF